MPNLCFLRRLPAAAVAASALLAAAPSAHAAPLRPAAAPSPPCVAQIEPAVLVFAGSYSPATRTSPTPGSKIEWDWSTATPESVTSNNGFPLLKSAAKTSGTYSVTFWSAGTFAYHSSTDTTQKGVVEIGICNVPKSAHAGHTVTFQVASVHHAGWVADIEVLRPGAAKWAWLHTNVTTINSSFAPKRTGTYQLRARLRNKTAKKSSGFSPISKVKVS